MAPFTAVERETIAELIGNHQTSMEADVNGVWNLWVDLIYF